MEEKRFNAKKLDKLNNPDRVHDFPIERVIEHAKLDSPKLVIDIGAGTGFYSIPIAKKYKDAKIYACDISDVMVSWMNENIIEEHKNIYPLIMDDNSINLEDEIADFVFMVNLHHELDSPEKALQESNRLLKPKGKIAISDWRKEETERGPSIDIRHATEAVEKQLIATGFKNISVFTDFPNNFLIIAEK